MSNETVLDNIYFERYLKNNAAQFQNEKNWLRDHPELIKNEDKTKENQNDKH